MIAKTNFIDRADLFRVFGSRENVRAFEQLQQTVTQTAEVVTANIDATDTISQATYITLSPNAELPNERVLALGVGLRFEVTDTQVKILSDAPNVEGGFSVTFVSGGDSTVAVPLNGILATRGNTETLSRKTLDAPKFAGMGNYADDAAAAVGGVPVGGAYLNAGALRVRVA